MDWTFHDVRAAHLGFLLCAAVGLTVASWLSARLSGRWGLALRLAVLFLAVRLALLDNPWIWQAYARVLDGRAAGWRQTDVVQQKLRSYLREEPVRYLAVGTSQTAAVYGGLAEERADLHVLSLAGLFPLDLALYRDRIAAHRPRCVLLYVSEWDLARKHEPEHLPLAPAQRLRLPGVALRVLALPGGEVYRRALVEAAVGELFPEFKYGFVFRALLREATAGRVGEASPGPGPPPAPPDLAALDRTLPNLEGRLTAASFPFHEAFLRAFLQEAEDLGIRVVLVEGRLMPRARRGSLAPLAERAGRILRGIAAEHPEVVFVPVESQPALGDLDFVDLTHVRPEVGLRLARSVLDRLDALGVGGEEPPTPERLFSGGPAPLPGADRPDSSDP